MVLSWVPVKPLALRAKVGQEKLSWMLEIQIVHENTMEIHVDLICPAYFAHSITFLLPINVLCSAYAAYATQTNSLSPPTSQRLCRFRGFRGFRLCCRRGLSLLRQRLCILACETVTKRTIFHNTMYLDWQTQMLITWQHPILVAIHHNSSKKKRAYKSGVGALLPVSLTASSDFPSGLWGWLHGSKFKLCSWATGCQFHFRLCQHDSLKRT